MAGYFNPLKRMVAISTIRFKISNSAFFIYDFYMMLTVNSDYLLEKR